MLTVDAACPQDVTLRDFLSGALSSAEFDDVASHLDHCAACRARIEALDGSGAVPYAESLMLAEPAPYADEPECRRTLARLETFGSVWPDEAGRTGSGSAEPMPDELPPKAVGHYELLEEIGRGGMGIVYRARDARLNRVVAIKMIRRDIFPSREELQRFRVEAEMAAGLDHPGIVPIYEVGAGEGLPYFAMALIPGASLAELGGDGPLAPVEAAKTAKEIAEALAYAHERGVIHRDIKPANLLVDSSGRPRISDFGLARKTEVESGLTGSGQILGTPSYMPPEQAEGRMDEIGVGSDVYSLGATLYYLLTGRPPFHAATKIETLRQVIERDPVAPRQLNRAIPRDLETICLKCLEKMPSRRYRSARELADDLERFLKGLPICARPVGVVGASMRWVRRRPVIAGLAAALAMAVVTGFVAVTWEWREARTRAQAERWARYRADMGAAAGALESNNATALRSALQSAPIEHRGWEWRHFASQLDRSSAVLGGHDSAVREVAFHPSGRWFASADGDGTIVIHDLDTRYPVVTLPSPGAPLKGMGFVGSGPFLAAGYYDRASRIWDIRTGTVRDMLTGGEIGTLWLHAAQDGRYVVSGANDGFLRVWDGASGRLLAAYPGHQPNVTSTALSPRGEVLATGSISGVVSLWNLGDGKVTTLKAGEVSVSALAFTSDGSRVVAGLAYPENTLCVFDVKTANLVGRAAGHANTITKVAASPDGRLIASASMDQTARLWDAATGKPVSVLRGHSGIIPDLAFSADSRRIVTASYDQSMRLWDTATSELVTVLNGHNATVWTVRWSPDGQRLASGASDRTVRLWSVSPLERNGVLRGHSSFVYDVAWSPDSRRVASVAWDGTLRVWDASTQQELTCESSTARALYSVAWSRDGTRMAVVRSDNQVEVREAAPKRSRTWSVRTDYWREHPDVAFRPDGRWLAAGDAEGQVALWNLGSGERASLSAAKRAWQTGVVFSPDGSLLASSGDDGIIRFWDVAARRCAAEFADGNAAVFRVAFRPDGLMLAAACGDDATRLWNVRDRRLEAVLPHGSIVYDVAFSPDGTRLATACADNAIRLWDVATRTSLVELRGHHDYVHAVAFSPDGTRLASASGDLTVRIWDTRTPLEREDAEVDARRAVRATTSTE